MNNNFNYILNGISHEININSSIKISSNPLDEKQLLSNKFMLKIINDLFVYLEIDYCLINKTLLGQKIFKGINIFENNLELLIHKHNIKKILKEEDYLYENKIYIHNQTKYLIIDTYFFGINTKCYIYLFHEENNKIYFYNYLDEIINLDFYDIFPLKKDIFEEFEVYIPNKIDNVLKNCNINLNFIHFKNNRIFIKDFLNKNKYITNLIIYLIFIFTQFSSKV